jgi:hypothetical protein
MKILIMNFLIIIDNDEGNVYDFTIYGTSLIGVLFIIVEWGSKHEYLGCT